MNSEASGCDARESVEPIFEQVVEYLVESGLENIGVQSVCQGMTKTGLERLYYEGVRCRDRMIDGSVLRDLKLTAKKVLKWKLVRAKVTQCDIEKEKASARLAKSGNDYRWLGGTCTTEEKDRSSTSSSSAKHAWIYREPEGEKEKA